jgi:hypothetical protein
MNAIPDCEAQELLHRLARAVNVHVRKLTYDFRARSRLILREICNEEMVEALVEALPAFLHRH